MKKKLRSKQREEREENASPSRKENSQSHGSFCFCSRQNARSAKSLSGKSVKTIVFTEFFLFFFFRVSHDKKKIKFSATTTPKKRKERKNITYHPAMKYGCTTIAFVAAAAPVVVASLSPIVNKSSLTPPNNKELPNKFREWEHTPDRAQWIKLNRKKIMPKR